jgi:hypothetical protein
MRLIDRTVRFATLGWLGAHFAATVLYVMPVNPINMALQPRLEATIGTYFGQNWCLFAPDPLVSDHALLVHCVHASEAADIKSSGLPSTGWYDISTPLWKRFQSNRFSAFDRLVRPQSNAMRQLLAGEPSAWEWRKACEKGSAEACKTYEKILGKEREEAGKYLRRIGCAFCLATSKDPASLTHVALRLRQTQPIPWSQRYQNPQRKVQDFDLAAYPIERDVNTISLFRTEGAQ